MNEQGFEKFEQVDQFNTDERLSMALIEVSSQAKGTIDKALKYVKPRSRSADEGMLPMYQFFYATDD